MIQHWTQETDEASGGRGVKRRAPWDGMREMGTEFTRSEEEVGEGGRGRESANRAVWCERAGRMMCMKSVVKGSDGFELAWKEARTNVITGWQGWGRWSRGDRLECRPRPRSLGRRRSSHPWYDSSGRRSDPW